MRVIAGRARGTKLYALEGLATRPTLDRIKEVMFSTIQYELRDGLVLDAFAGSGALGIEALSRGAKYCDFCEKDEKAFEVLKKNVIKTHFMEQAGLHRKDIFTFLEGLSKPYDVVLLDPPYERGFVSKVLCSLSEKGLLKQGALVVVESERSLEVKDLPEGFKLRKRKDYSSSSLSFYDYTT